MIELIEPAIKDLKVEKILVSGISRSHHAYLQNWKISKISSEIIYNYLKQNLNLYWKREIKIKMTLNYTNISLILN